MVKGMQYFHCTDILIKIWQNGYMSAIPQVFYKL